MVLQKLVSGIGLNFINDEVENQLRVKSILKGGSAEKNGNVRVGDILLGVGSKDVQGMPAPELRNVLRGEVGKAVLLTFMRVDGENGGTSSYEVNLIRGHAEKNMLDEKTRMQQEIEESRKRSSYLKVEEQTLISERMQWAQLVQSNSELMRRLSSEHARAQEQIKVHNNAIEEIRLTKSRFKETDEEAEIMQRIAVSEIERSKLTKLLSEVEPPHLCFPIAQRIPLSSISNPSTPPHPFPSSPGRGRDRQSGWATRQLSELCYGAGPALP
jgi:hypothetical protein